MGEARRRASLGISHAKDVIATQPKDVTIPERILEDFSTRYPDIWRLVDRLKADPKGSIGMTWEPWCYVPINGAMGLLHYALQGEYTEEEAEAFFMQEGRELAALAAWRMSKGVYVFDATVIQELFDSEVADGVPDELFLHLPEWCVYIATPGLTVLKEIKLHGFFAFVDDQVGQQGQKPPELNFLLAIDVAASAVAGLAALASVSFSAMQDMADALNARAPGDAEIPKPDKEFMLMPLQVELGQGSFAAALQAKYTLGLEMRDRTIASLSAPSVAEAELLDAESAADLDAADAQEQTEDWRVQMMRLARDAHAGTPEEQSGTLNLMLDLHLRLASLVMYLCSAEPDIQVQVAGSQSRAEAQAKHRRGQRVFAAKQIAQWQVGFRIGADIRAAQAASHLAGAGDGALKRPHVRRAHWHTYWVGPRLPAGDTRAKRVKWLHPMLINVAQSQDLVPTVHKTPPAVTPQ